MSKLSKRTTNLRITILMILLALTTLGLSAQDATTVYLEGWVDLKTRGETYELFIGDILEAGDKVITASDGFVELEMENDSVVKISPDTIFEVREVETEQGRESVFACAVGRVGFKFNQMTKEPSVATSSVVGGVRGTEFELYSAADGSSFIAVTQGQVDISSGGETLSLMANEGADVSPGMPPGEKINLLEQEMDFSQWAADKKASLLANPRESLAGLSLQLEEFYRQIELLMEKRTALMSEQDERRVTLEKIRAEEDQEAVTAYYKQEIFPLEVETMAASFNVRYYSLSALSLRRNILGSLYMEMKSRSILDRDNPQWTEFQDDYQEVLQRFEEMTGPYLVPADI